MLKTCDLYDLRHSLAGEYLSGFEYPWQALKGIKNLILSLGPALGEDYREIAPTVWVHETATVFPSAYLGAPCIIGPGAEIRHCGGPPFQHLPHLLRPGHGPGKAHLEERRHGHRKMVTALVGRGHDPAEPPG